VTGGLALGCLSRPNEDSIELSYFEISPSCEGCAGFEVTFRSGGHVQFNGHRGCALPGRHDYAIPEADWHSLVERFRSTDFFSIPRLGPHVFDADAFRITYRDARRIHEVIDTARGDKQLNALEKALRTAARVEPWITPSPELYRKALAERWDVNSRNEDGWNALTCAVSRKREDAVRVLLDAGSKVSPEEFTLAVWFATAPNARMLRMLDTAAPLDVHGPLAAELLVEAARANPDALGYLLDRGVPINARDRQGRTALYNVGHGEADLATLDLLISRGADVNAVDGSGHSPLYYAAEAANTGFTTALAHAGAIVDAPDRDGVTPLLHAIDRCTYWNILALVDVGANPAPAIERIGAPHRRWDSAEAARCVKTEEVLTELGSKPGATGKSHR
jgi:hypothetical protein